MARGDVVIANSHYTADLIRSRSARRRPTGVRVIHRGTDFSAFAPRRSAPERVEALRRGWGVAPHQRVVLLPRG